MKKKSIIVILSIILSISLKAQTKCEVENLTRNEKNELSKFWTDFKFAIKNKNVDELNKLFNFPFNCSFCVSDSFPNSPYITIISKFNFNQYLDTLFFSKNFDEVLNKQSIFQVLYSELGENDECNLSISFPIIEPSKNGEGMQGFFTIKKIGGKYKIVGAWSVP